MGLRRLAHPLVTGVFVFTATACGGTVVFEEDGGRGDGGGGGSGDATSGEGASNGATKPSTASTATGTPGTTGTGTPGRPTEEQLCEFFCSCAGCSSADQRDCVESAEEYYDNAERAGCNAELDAYVACFFDAMECVNEAPSLEECDESLQTLNFCLD